MKSGINTQGLKFLELKKFDEDVKVLALNNCFRIRGTLGIVLQKLICKKERRT